MVRDFRSFVVYLLLTAILVPAGCSPTTPATNQQQPTQSEDSRTLPNLTTRTPSQLVPETVEREGARIEFLAEDGQELVGYYYPSWKPFAPVVILMHEFGNRQTAWHESSIIPWLQNWNPKSPAISPLIYARGRLPSMPEHLSFAVLTFDFRGHGESRTSRKPIRLDKNTAGFLMDAKAAYNLAGMIPGVDGEHMIGIGTSIGADAVVDACGVGCSGAYSISPGNWLKVDYGEAVRGLLELGKSVRCM